jgi:hypothetical protein
MLPPSSGWNGREKKTTDIATACTSFPSASGQYNEQSAVRRNFGPKTVEVKEWRNLHNEELNSLYFSQNEPAQLGGIALSYGLDDLGFETRQWLGIFSFIPKPRPALGPTQPPIQWIPAALSLGVKRPRREAHHSPPPSVDVKKELSHTSTSLIRLHGVVLS